MYIHTFLGPPDLLKRMILSKILQFLKGSLLDIDNLEIVIS